MKHFLKKNWFIVCIILVILLAIFLRFYNYENRWGLAYDQARDVIVAREALRTGKIPLIGPFTSVGQFVYGPQWYWILMLMVGVYPNLVITPWVIQTLFYVGVVLLMIIIGKEIEDRFLGLVVGLFTAISTAQITQATNLTSPAMVGVCSIISLYLFVKYVKDERLTYAFWMAFVVGTAINIHFQALGLLVFIPVAFVFDKKKSLKKFLFLSLGAIIPFIPLIIFDLSNNFFESKNWIEYYLYGQYRVYVPNRWLTYVGTYWPVSWAKIIGGEKIIGYLPMFVLPLAVFIAIVRKKMTKSLTAIAVSFLLIFIILRYYRGERIDSYLIFLQPFVLIVTGWLCVSLYKFNRILGLGLILLIIIPTLKLDITQINNSENMTAVQINEWKNIIINKFPNKKFAFYDYKYKNGYKSLPLVLFLDIDKKIDDRQFKLGFFVATSETRFTYPTVLGVRGNYQILNLNSLTNEKLSKEGWAFINPSQIYHSTVEWYKE